MWIEAASKLAPEVDSLMDFTNILMIVPLILVNAVMIYFIVKYRRRGDNDVTSSVAHNTTIEVVWTVVPTILMFILFFWGLNVFVKMRTVPADAMNIDVTARKWNWDFFYPTSLVGKSDGKRLKAGLLYLQENKHTRLIMKSKDVIHSFFVPAFRSKEDVVGNMNTYVAFSPLITKQQKAMNMATRKDPCGDLYRENQKLADDRKLSLKSCGAYRVYCTEYCGKDHSAMLSWAVVLEPADFKKKLESLQADAGNISAERGKSVYGKCTACHSTDGSRRLGPSFKGLFGKKREFIKGVAPLVADENYLRESVKFPKKKVVKGFPDAMPPQGLTEAELESVILYIKSLK